MRACVTTCVTGVGERCPRAKLCGTGVGVAACQRNCFTDISIALDTFALVRFNAKLFEGWVVAET